jgi:hypothetical protein
MSTQWHDVVVLRDAADRRRTSHCVRERRCVSERVGRAEYVDV